MSNYFSDNRIQLNAFSNCPKTGKWVHRGQTKFAVTNSDDKTIVDVSEAVVDCNGSASRSAPTTLKCIVATRGVYSYNVAIELNPPTLEQDSSLQGISVSKVTTEQAFYNPINYYPTQAQRVMDHSYIIFLKDASSTVTQDYLKNDFLIHIYSSVNPGDSAKQPLGFLTSSDLKKTRNDLYNITP